MLACVAETAVMGCLMQLSTTIALLAAACNAPAGGMEDEKEVRMRLQAAHDATARLELSGRLDMDAIARGVREVRAWWSEDSVAQIERLIQTLLPRYRAEGKSYVTIAFGCTGGRHRSVHVAARVAQTLRMSGYEPTLTHRNLDSAPQDGLEGRPPSATSSADVRKT